MKKENIESKVLDLFYINGNIAVNIDDFINDYEEKTELDKRFIITSIKNHQEEYNKVLSEIVKELEKQITER